MNAIRDWLYVGKYREMCDATLLAVHKIGAMLQLAEAVDVPGIESLYLPVEDGVSLAGSHLQQGVDFVLNQKHLGRRVLVACGAGMSRSAAFAVAVLKEDEKLPLLEALRVTRICHPDTMVHSELWASLCVFYREDVPLQSVLDVMLSGKMSR